MRESLKKICTFHNKFVQLLRNKKRRKERKKKKKNKGLIKSETTRIINV
jgi:hypothetical protein